MCVLFGLTLVEMDVLGKEQTAPLLIYLGNHIERIAIQFQTTK